MDMTDQRTASPLSCPRCGCADSRVIDTRRETRGKEPEPLPVLRRVRECQYCRKQFRTRETVEEQSLSSTVWRASADLPPGEYQGRWTRFEVVVQLDGQAVTLNTRNDLRVADYPCRVTVTDHGISVESGV